MAASAACSLHVSGGPSLVGRAGRNAITGRVVAREHQSGVPGCDQGRNFESTLVKEVCYTLGIRKTRTTALHPQSDGMVERFIRTLTEHFKKVVNKNQRDWDTHIATFLMCYRSAVHETTGETPAKVIFGNDLRLPADLKFGTCLKRQELGHYAQELRKELNDVHASVRARTKIMSDRMKARYDKAINSNGFQEAALVMLYNPRRKRGLCPKLQCNWEGPYKVIKRINDVVYRIQDNSKKRAKLKVVHLERLAPFYGCGLSDRVDQT